MNRKYGGMLITPIQIVQFVVALLIVTYEGIFMEQCGTPMAMSWLWFTYVVFLVFFIKLYWDKKRERQHGRVNVRALDLPAVSMICVGSLGKEEAVICDEINAVLSMSICPYHLSFQTSKRALLL